MVILVRELTFLSTPSARRATRRLGLLVGDGGISIHALREEGDVDRADVPEGVVISIHALREEGDVPQQRLGPVQQISIHALREEGDFFC